MKVYKVGGAIRDRLLGLPVKDCDWVVVGATPAEMEAQGYTMVGRDFPVFLHPGTHEEYALARTERKVAAGYHGFTVEASPEVTLEEDLARRDLTINAMAEDDEGHIIDPYNGQQDLRQGILRHVSPAFSEDPVRILRVARFAARFDFRIAPETLELMQHMVVAGEVGALVPERVWAELERALGESHPQRFIGVLRECGALVVLFPEIDCLFGIPQPARYHPEIDTGDHVLRVLRIAEALSEDTRVRFAALVHDLGKGATPKGQWPHHRGHEERGVRLVRALCERLRIPNDYRELAEQVARHHLHCHRAFELRADTVLKILQELDAFRRPERFARFLLVCEADARGRKGLETQPYPQAGYLRRVLAAAQAVDSSEIIAAGFSGKAIGEELQHRRVAAIAALRQDSSP